MELKLTKKETVLTVSAIAVVILVAGKLFYGVYWAGVFLAPLGVVIFRQRKKTLIEKKISEYESQFKDMLVSLSDSLGTGYSIENAIRESYTDIKNIYGTDSDICREMRLMISQLALNENTEKVIWNFAIRSGLKNAKMFAEIFSVAKKTGGNMPNVIKSVTNHIVLKEVVREEIAVAINEKKAEERVMTFIPMFLILYVSMSSPGFLTVMYETVLGKVLMSVCVIAYVVAYLWAEKVMKFEM